MIRALLSLAVVLLLSGRALAEPVKVRVESGLLAGAEADGVAAFRNIPYAAPPVGALRWAPPARPLAWSGERDASQKGPSCLQKMNPDGSPNSGGANGPMSEDCLQLNVFAPTGAKAAPVMVWLHGGSFTEGAGWVYDGSKFARDGVVLVAINYRLGPLGYFAHPALTRAARSRPVANYGLMDQIAALEWVKRNIAAFGGDPANVTIFGTSAGGMSVLDLLATPRARGLYMKAIVQSAPGFAPLPTLAAAEARGVAAANELGLPGSKATAAQLRAVPAETIVARLSGQTGPILDGKLLVESPAQALASGHAADVPLIIGSNSGEGSLIGPWKPEYAARIPALARPLYPQEAAVGDEFLARTIFADTTMAAPARWIAARASGGRPAWLYHFSYVGSRFRGFTKLAFHAAEVQYVFEYWGRRTPMSLVSDEDKAMATLMHSCWVAFAKTGQPRCASGPDWPAYDPAGDQLMEFGQPSGVRAHFRKPQLDAAEAYILPGLKLTK